MKIKNILTATVIVGVLAAGSAQAAVVFSSIDNTGGTQSNLTSLSGKAINFVIGSGTDYTLDNVVLNIGTINGAAAPVVSIWANETGGTPIAGPNPLETLTLSGTFTANSLNTFTSTGLSLQADTTYWLVVRGENTSSFAWLGDTDAATVGTNNNRLFGNGGSTPDTWNSASGILNAATINATAVPEPSSVGLLGLGGLALILRRRRN
ncbi:MAG: choice-of-anchor R domain-containing protein [Luteolibacter sp.]